MIIERDGDDTVSTFDGNAFNIAVNAKSFEALFSGIYSDKIGAVVREIGSNCHDAHIMAGAPKKPFTIVVTRDATRQSNVAFIDEGTGMTKEQLTNLYTTFFNSNKDNSNDFIGGFGVGSKSPLSYTDNFSITTIKDGKKNIGEVTMVEGIPHFDLLVSDSPTHMPNGTAVTVPIQISDCATFLRRAYSEFVNFTPFPIIRTNMEEEQHDLEAERSRSSSILKTDKFTINTRAQSVNYIVIGGITYKNSFSEGNNCSKDHNCQYTWYADVGEFDVTLSREHLADTEKNRARLQEIDEIIEGSLFDELIKAEKADYLSHSWIRYRFREQAAVSEEFFNKLMSFWDLDVDYSERSDKNYMGNVYTSGHKDYTSLSIRDSGARNVLEMIDELVDITRFSGSLAIVSMKENLVSPIRSIRSIHRSLQKSKYTKIVYVKGEVQPDDVYINVLKQANDEYLETNSTNYKYDTGMAKRTKRRGSDEIPTHELIIGSSRVSTTAATVPYKRMDITDPIYGQVFITEKANYEPQPCTASGVIRAWLPDHTILCTTRANYNKAEVLKRHEDTYINLDTRSVSAVIRHVYDMADNITKAELKAWCLAKARQGMLLVKHGMWGQNVNLLNRDYFVSGRTEAEREAWGRVYSEYEKNHKHLTYQDFEDIVGIDLNGLAAFLMELIIRDLSIEFNARYPDFNNHAKLAELYLEEVLKNEE